MAITKAAERGLTLPCNVPLSDPISAKIQWIAGLEDVILDGREFQSLLPAI